MRFGYLERSETARTALLAHSTRSNSSLAQRDLADGVTRHVGDVEIARGVACDFVGVVEARRRTAAVGAARRFDVAGEGGDQRGTRDRGTDLTPFVGPLPVIVREPVSV